MAILGFVQATGSSVASHTGDIGTIAANTGTNTTIQLTSSMTTVAILPDSSATVVINGIGPIPVNSNGFVGVFDKFTAVTVECSAGWKMLVGYSSDGELDEWYTALSSSGSSGTSTVTTGRTTAVAGKTVVTTAGTPVTLGSQACGDGVTVIANPANTGKVYVFPAAGSKTDVVPLAAGDSNFFPVANISALKVDADTSGDSVYWQGAV